MAADCSSTEVRAVTPDTAFIERCAPWWDTPASCESSVSVKLPSSSRNPSTAMSVPGSPSVYLTTSTHQSIFLSARMRLVRTIRVLFPHALFAAPEMNPDPDTSQLHQSRRDMAGANRGPACRPRVVTDADLLHPKPVITRFSQYLGVDEELL